MKPLSPCDLKFLKSVCDGTCFVPCGATEWRACNRLVMFGLARFYRMGFREDSKSKKRKNVDVPMYRLTTAGRAILIPSSLPPNDLKFLKAAARCEKNNGFVPHGSTEWMRCRRLEKLGLVRFYSTGFCENCESKKHYQESTEVRIYRLTQPGWATLRDPRYKENEPKYEQKTDLHFSIPFRIYRTSCSVLGASICL